MDPIASRVARRTVTYYCLPTSSAARVRFASQKVDVVLPHEESSLIDRVWAINSFVIGNCYGGGSSYSHDCAARIAQTDGEIFTSFCIGIVNDGNRNCLNHFTGGEANRAHRSCIVAPRRGNSIYNITVRQTCRITRRVVHRGFKRSGPYARYEQIGPAPVLDYIGCQGSELNRRVIIQNCGDSLPVPNGAL